MSRTPHRFKFVCLTCRVAFKDHRSDTDEWRPTRHHRGHKTTLGGIRWRAPKKRAVRTWKLVEAHFDETGTLLAWESAS
jgi:hypothetical protein